MVGHQDGLNGFLNLPLYMGIAMLQRWLSLFMGKIQVIMDLISKFGIFTLTLGIFGLQVRRKKNMLKDFTLTKLHLPTSLLTGAFLIVFVLDYMLLMQTALGLNGSSVCSNIMVLHLILIIPL